MKKFLNHTGIFILVSILITTLMVIATAYYTKTTFNYKISANKNVLVLGNSHPECAINDSILPTYYNLAQGGSAYFYDYLKLREIIKHNVQLDTLIIGYSYGDLKEKMNTWITDEDKIDYKLRTHLFLLRPEDYLTLLDASLLNTLKYTPQTILHNIKTKFKGLPYLGGFKPLKNHRLQKSKEILQPLSEKEVQNYSHYQTEYLLKIYNLCQSKDIKVILLNTPIHPLLKKNQEPLIANYCKFARDKMPKALLVDHSMLTMPESAYRDLSHLHETGAKIYSHYLRNKKSYNSFKLCP